MVLAQGCLSGSFEVGWYFRVPPAAAAAAAAVTLATLLSAQRVSHDYGNKQ